MKTLPDRPVKLGLGCSAHDEDSLKKNLTCRVVGKRWCARDNIPLSNMFLEHN